MYHTQLEITKSLDYDITEGLAVHDNSMFEPDEAMNSLVSIEDFIMDIIRDTYSLTDQWRDRLFNQRRQRIRLS